MTVLLFMGLFILILSFTLLVSYYLVPHFYIKIRIKKTLLSKKKKMKKNRGAIEKKAYKWKTKKLLDRINVTLEEANIPINAMELIVLIFWSNIIVFLLTTLLFSLLTGIIVPLFITPMYFFVLSLLRKRRKKKMIQQLPEVLELITNALKTGYSIIQTIDLIAKENFSPLSDEFEKIYFSIRYGSSLDKALTDFAERVEIEEITILTDTIVITRETGGNLTTVVDQLLETLREKTKIKDEIKALTSQGRISAIIVGSMPIAIFSILMLINPEYMRLLFSHPVGYGIIGLSVFSQLIGVLFMRKIINLKVR